MKVTAGVTAVCSLLLVAGCTSTSDFPDISGYADSGSTYEQVNVPRAQGFRFTTPSGLICTSNAYPDTAYESVDCLGPLPHQGPGDWSVSAGRTSAAIVESVNGDPDFPQDKIHPPPPLPPMHRLTAGKGDAVCAVDDKGMTACRVGEHGFVLMPDRTTLF
ncbi:hypothetical protein [Mycobacterium sp. NPDC050441]|uniref:hypothetical protein n=1 Tax=Mycobacterium sp. NPDC050441 TaxID=3155403 RepID=UPI0033EFDFAF